MRVRMKRARYRITIRPFNSSAVDEVRSKCRGEVYGITHITRLGFATVHGPPVGDDINTKYILTTRSLQRVPSFVVPPMNAR